MSYITFQKHSQLKQKKTNETLSSYKLLYYKNDISKERRNPTEWEENSQKTQQMDD